MTENPREAALTQAEEDRQAAQAPADSDLDPNSQAGRQAAVKRGAPVQLTGSERDAGRQDGTVTTSNESTAPPASGHNFVTGAAGFPLPASGGQDPERPGDFNPDMSEDGGDDTGPPPKSALKSDWVDHAVYHGVPREEAETMTKDELVNDPRLSGGSDGEDHGDHGPGVTA